MGLLIFIAKIANSVKVVVPQLNSIVTSNEHQKNGGKQQTKHKHTFGQQNPQKPKKQKQS